MPKRKSGRRSGPLFLFDRPFRDTYGCIAGVDEAGRGPLAGPVVAGAVILPDGCRIPHLADSKLLNAAQRWTLYRHIQRCACAIGVGIIDHVEIDRINIYQATMAAMRAALGALIIQPTHVLVDGFAIRNGPPSQTGIIDGDRKSASIAAAAIVAKVTRDCLMEEFDRRYPGYGFAKHKGYGTRVHLECLKALGPSPIHRRSFTPVRITEALLLSVE